MAIWSKVRWTQARQVTRLLGVKDAEAPAESVSPAAHFEALKADGALSAAVSFLGVALPRYEGVAWATGVLGALPSDETNPGDRLALAAARRWVEDPDEPRRREAYDAAGRADDDAPERLLGFAVFMSGGSIAPPDQGAVNPDPEVCGKLAAAAIITAAHRSPDANSQLAAALEAGEKYATGEA
ncbi:hypothetical protein ABC347_16160 [Sphingomonas sp. 1P06PA]|uniref:DUF6931 family protein n=1 Tax=Sphingomonas sp. 1P06PA TaxID=554121 RepID=UPI0039A74B91